MTKNDKCPCEECISYAICVGQRQPRCNDIIEFYINNMNESRYRFPKDLWYKLKEMFPNALSIRAQGVKNHHISITYSVPCAWYDYDTYGVRKL